MKTRYVILLIVTGLLFYLAGIALGGNGMAMGISLLGGCIMALGLFLIIDNDVIREKKKR